MASASGILNYEGIAMDYTPIDATEIAVEVSRLAGSCSCGAECPSRGLCRENVARITGREQTKAVCAWMRAGLCVCPFVVPNKERGGVTTGRVSDRNYTKQSGNWSAKRRRKLVRCPCGVYFCNATVRA